jgi:hypothetical protein
MHDSSVTSGSSGNLSYRPVPSLSFAPSLSLTLTELNETTVDSSFDLDPSLSSPFNWSTWTAAPAIASTISQVARQLVQPAASTTSGVPFDRTSATFQALEQALTLDASVEALWNGTSSNASTLMSGGESSVSDSYHLQPWKRLAWLLIFGGMVLVAAIGNAVVIWIVLVNRQMRTVTNAFIVNLSIADIMVSTLNVIFNFVYMLNGDWRFGSTYCKVSNFIAILSVAASVFTLMAISIDR